MTPAEVNAILAAQAADEQQRQQQNQPNDVLGTLAAIGAGAAAVLGGQRLLRGRNTGATFDLSQFNPKNIRRAAANIVEPKPSAPPPPKTSAERLQQIDDVTRQARSERMPGIRQGKLPSASELAAAEKLLGDTELLKYVEAEEMALANVLPENRAEQSRQQAQVRRAQSALADQVRADLLAEQTEAVAKTANTSQAAAQSDFVEQYMIEQGYRPKPTLVDQQTAQNPVTVDQTAAATLSAEDQETGRVMRAIQRNEDENLGAVNAAKEQAEARLENIVDSNPDFASSIDLDAAVNQVASKLPDGLPIDQAEGTTSAQRFLARERDEIASQLGEQGLTPSPGRIDAELARRLGSSASEYGPQYSARRQSLELFAQTGDPKLLERVQRFGMAPATFETFENMPAAKRAGFEASAPFSTEYYPSENLSAVGLSSDVEINLPGQGRVSLADVRKPVITEDTALAAEGYYQEKKGEALDWLGDLRVQLEPKRNAILKERRALAEQSAQQILPQLEAARQAGQVQTAKELEGQLNNLRNLWKNPELGSHRADEYRYLTAQIEGAQKKIGESISEIQKKYPTTLSDWSGEAGRVFGEVDPSTGEFIPETMELRAERRTADLPQKGGGGRNVAEFTAGERIDEELRAIQGGGRIRDYDPETGGAVSPWTGDKTQTGRTIDEYGIRLSGEKPANPELRPSQPQYTKAEIADEAMRLASSAPEGDVPLAPDYDAVIESLGSQPKTEAAMRSVLMSEAIRKAERMRAGRNPRGGVLPDEITRLRTQMGQLEGGQGTRFGPRPTVAPGTTEPQQLGLKGISGYSARQRKSEADIAAEQLDAYLSKLQRGRSTPLTSEAVIQPRIF